MKIYSWNVNGVRAILKKGFLDWFAQSQADIICLQESKAKPEQLGFELTQVPGYEAYFAAAERPGYSGTITYTKPSPQKVDIGLNKPEFDREGRVIVTHYPEFSLLNIYFPNGKASNERLEYKMAFYDYLLIYLKALAKKQPNIIICGDVNTAHQPIDLARPQANEKISGFLPVERAWIDRLIDSGFIDSYRHLHPNETDAYTWWSMRSGARQRNVGWRIDYFFISESIKNQLKAANIHPAVTGSDHCPISIDLKF